MTTPVKGRSKVYMQTNIPPTPTVTPAVVHHAPPRVNHLRRFMDWQSSFKQRHPFTWWLVLIAVSLISFRIWWGAMSTWPAFRAYFICFAIFWGTCIGMLPITACLRSGQNIMEDIFK